MPGRDDVILALVMLPIGAVLALTWRLVVRQVRDAINREGLRQARQIAGDWLATETCDRDGVVSVERYRIHLRCSGGGDVTGSMVGLDGVDEGRTFDIRGVYHDRILNFVWTAPAGEGATTSGSTSLKFLNAYEDTSDEATLTGFDIFDEGGLRWGSVKAVRART